jgi:hypothetical protein
MDMMGNSGGKPHPYMNQEQVNNKVVYAHHLLPGFCRFEENKESRGGFTLPGIRRVVNNPAGELLSKHTGSSSRVPAARPDR